MNKNICRLMLSTLLLAGLTVSGYAATTFYNGADNGDYATGSNWSMGAVPDGDIAIINQDRIALISSNISQTQDTIRVANNASGGTLNMTGGQLVWTGRLSVARAASSTGVFYKVGSGVADGQTLSIAAQLGSTASGTTGDVTVVMSSGGGFKWKSGTVGTDGYGRFRVVGTGPGRIEANNLTLGDDATLAFVFDVNGIEVLDIAGFVRPTNATLVIDGSDFGIFTGGDVQTFPLIECDDITIPFDTNNVFISGFDGVDAQLSYTSEGLDLVLTRQNTGIICGDLRNGNFNEPASTGSQNFENTTFWENIEGSQTISARNDNSVVEGHSLVINSALAHLAAQDTGHDVRTDDRYSVSYQWREGAGFDDADDRVRVILFVTDDNTISGTQTVLATLDSELSTSNATFEPASGVSGYAPASAHNKRLFVSIDLLDGNADANDNGQVDVFCLTVSNDVDIPTLNEWGMIILFLVLVGLGMRQMRRAKRATVPAAA